MASNKSYAYYVKGNKIALVQRNNTDSNATGESYHEFKSPTEAVTNGIEIEHTYSPIYTVPAKRVDSGTADTYHFYNGWFVVDGYLTLGATWTDFVNDASIAVDSYILIEGSDRWDGLHKVQEVQDILGTNTHGGIKTYTKVNESTKYWTDSSVSWNTAETITGMDTSFPDIFSADGGDNEYLWVVGSDAHMNNNGMFSHWSFSGTTLSFVNAKWYSSDDLAEVVYDVGASQFQTDGAHPVHMYEAFRENGGAKFYSSVTILEDESSNIELSSFLSKAAVYYVKAKMAEDAGQIDLKEYFMKEYRKILSRHEDSKITGMRRVASFGMTK